MENTRHLFFASALMLTSPLAAQWYDCYPTAINPGICGEGMCGGLVSIEIDYLLWFPYLDGISYGIAFPEISSNTSNYSYQQNKENDLFFETNWDSGVRASFGYQIPHRSWNIAATYTNYGTQLKKHFNGLSNNVESALPLVGDHVANQYLPIDYIYGLSSLSGNWKINFNQFDIDFGKEFYLSDDLSLRPYFGVRGLLLNHTFTTINSSEITGTPRQVIANESQFFKSQNQFNGAGIIGGFTTCASLFEGLDLYGNLGANITWGYFKIKQTSNIILIESSGFFPALLTGHENIVSLNHSHQTTVFNFDLGIGLKWSFLLNRTNLLTLKFGWEQHIYSNINQLVAYNPLVSALANEYDTFEPFNTNVTRGYLTLSGFEFGLEYLF